MEFARGLHELGVEIISTGGTMKAIADAGIPVISVSDVTGFPEMMDGRVKTLHPKIHGGILAIRDNPEHVKAMKEHGITGIDLVAVNLYPFRETIAKPDVTLAEAIENIDIGGPSMVRAAAKNYKYVTIVVDPSQYGEILTRIKEDTLTEDFRLKLSQKAFLHTGLYDCAIADYLEKQVRGDKSDMPDVFSLAYTKIQELRYGENPHQKAAFYKDPEETGGIAAAKQLHGKELSYNNIVDMEAAWDLAMEWKDVPACTIIKHTNPCGTALGATPAEAFKRAFEADSKSAYGGIVAMNRECDKETAEAMKPIFFEVVLARNSPTKHWLCWKRRRTSASSKCRHSPSRNCRSRRSPAACSSRRPMTARKRGKTAPSSPTVHRPRRMGGHGICMENRQARKVQRHRSHRQGRDLRHRRRPDEPRRLCGHRHCGSGRKAKGSVLASDAFFPFGDTIEAAGKAGITAVIQPGGSIRDQESIDMANKYGIAMVFTGHRHFRHG